MATAKLFALYANTITYQMIQMIFKTYWRFWTVKKKGQRFLTQFILE